MGSLMKPGGQVHTLDQVREYLAKGWIAEEKIDGQSGWIVFDDTGKLHAYRANTDVTANLPAYRIPDLAGVEVQVEWACGEGKSTSSEVTRMLAEGGWSRVARPRAYILDVLRNGEEDLSSVPYVYRAHWARVIAWCIDGWAVDVQQIPFVVVGPHYEVSDCLRVIRRWLDEGAEGLVLKDPASLHTVGRSPAWIKYKPVRTIDCWVRSYAPGGGKYAGLLGAIHLDLWDAKTGKFVRVGQCSGMSDADRIKMTARLDCSDAFAVEVCFQNWTGAALRHPRFRGYRPDKFWGDCDVDSQLPELRNG